MEAHLELQELARTTAETINKLANWDEYTAFNHHDHNHDYDEGDRLMSMLAKKEGILSEVAMKRARASGRNFETVLDETRLEFFLQEAEIFKKESPMDDPRMAAMQAVDVEDNGGEAVVCGVCQEEFAVGEKEVFAPACMHKFHGLCLWKWLSEHKTCPLCRFCILD